MTNETKELITLAIEQVSLNGGTITVDGIDVSYTGDRVKITSK